jgi:hypothetical protein
MNNRRGSVPEKVRRLFDIRNRYGTDAAAEKLALLGELAGPVVKSASDLELLHSALCFIRAFPDSEQHHRRARAQLEAFHRRVENLSRQQRAKLDDSGIAGTDLYYAFSFHVAQWLYRRARGAITIDWAEMEHVERLDDLLELVLHGSEDEYFNSGWVTGREWLDIARGDTPDFDWLMAQTGDRARARTWAQLYDAANISLRWQLDDGACSKGTNAYPAADIVARSAGMRRGPAFPKQEILRPLNKVEKLSRRDGSRMIDLAMASLALRHRETWHFNHANPEEIYLADVGEGVSVALFGLLPEYRFPLECTMGYLVLANGAPVGYGGSSILFRQVNTGVNVFDEYRGSEAAFIWIQVMRVYHHLTGCTRYIANAYQFGADNDEALQSGAFWFYYRLGYRPVAASVRRLAASEWQCIRADRGYRSSLSALRRLSSCDMHLTLPGARASELFDERWIETSSLLATRELAKAHGKSRTAAARWLARQVAHDVGVEDIDNWTRQQRRALELIAPFVAATEPHSWPARARRAFRDVLASKGAPDEVGFARRMGRHDVFLQALRTRCRAAERKPL